MWRWLTIPVCFGLSDSKWGVWLVVNNFRSRCTYILINVIKRTPIRFKGYRETREEIWRCHNLWLQPRRKVWKKVRNKIKQHDERQSGRNPTKESYPVVQIDSYQMVHRHWPAGRAYLSSSSISSTFWSHCWRVWTGCEEQGKTSWPDDWLNGWMNGEGLLLWIGGGRLMK